MIKEIKTEKFEGLAVLVPDDIVAWNIRYHMDGKLRSMGLSTTLEAYELCVLPDASWSIMGKATELTEEQCTEIVGLQFGANSIYKSYEDITSVDTAKESFDSLMNVSGCYSENPYGLEKPEYNPYDREVWAFNTDNWSQAQASTGTWLILQKL